MANSSIGTAWIQIKPSMKGVSSSIKQSLTGVGSSVGASEGKAFTGKWAAATGAIAGITSTVVSAAASKISENISGAISRIDALNQFPKVLANFGVSADESAEAINRISERMQGLPTTLDQAAGGVRNLFMVTKDLSAAEAMFYAINDAAMVFAGGSTEAVDRFIYAFKQSMSSGKVLAQDFNQMNEAIPGLMDKVAEAMGITFGELKTGLSDGSISMDEFNKTLTKLDTEGGAGMSALSESAKSATGCIETAFNNMNTAIQRGIASAIDSIGTENIQAAAENIGKAFENVGKVIGGIINFIKENEPVRVALLSFLATLGTLMMLTVVPAFIAWAASLLANPITWIVLGVTALITGIVLLVSHIQEVGAWFNSVFSAIGEWFGNLFTQIGTFFTNVWQTIVNFFKPIIEWITNAAQWIWNTFYQPVIDFLRNAIIVIVAILATLVEWVYNTIILPIVNFLVNLWNNVVQIVTNIWNAITTVIGVAAQWVYDNVIAPVTNFFIGLWNTIAGIISGIWSTVTSIFGTIGSWIYNNVISPIANFFTGLWNGIKSGVEAAANVIKTIFSTVVGVIKAPINAIIDAINGVIDTINSITVPDWVPGIGGAHANIPHVPRLATGGLVEGIGTDTSDSNLYALSKGEYVIRAAAAREIGYNNLEAMNKTGEVGTMTMNNNFYITGDNPKEIANEVSRIIALKQRGVY